MEFTQIFLLLQCPLTNLFVYFSFFQDSSHFHPFIHTKMNFSTKSPLHPQSISHADSLSPGPFSHLGPIFGDFHDNSYSPYRRNALYNKVRDLASQKSVVLKRYGFGGDSKQQVNQI